MVGQLDVPQRFEGRQQGIDKGAQDATRGARLLQFSHMKIRTQEELFDRIADDLVWRRRELVLFSSQLDKVNSEFSRALLHGSVALLYAHWEGFVKNACHYYLCYLSARGVSFSQLIPEIAALALRGRISEAIVA